MMQPTEQLAHILPALTALVDRIEPRQLNDATPCDKFTVHDVLDHMLVGGAAFAYAFRGEQAPEIKAPPVYGVVPNAQFRSAMDGLLIAVQSGGAMQRPISSPMGEMSGEEFARFVAFDGLMHGWDLATATGQPYEPPAAVVEAVDEFARAAITQELRDGDTFKDETTPPSGAGRLERLVAFSGRSL